MKFKIFLVTLVAVILAGCPAKREAVEENIFTKGERIKSGFKWERTDIPYSKIVDGSKLVKVFEDNFDREELGENYTVLGGDWKIEDGKVVSERADNKNLVLSGIDLPQNGVIKLVMKSLSDFVDIKFNLWGNGELHEHGDGYSFILGGWKNRVSVIAKLHEHEKKRFEERATRLDPDKEYHIKVVRKGKEIYWFVNDSLFLVYFDDSPLKAEDGYNKLSFANWRSHAVFGDLEIYEFKGE